MTNIRIIDRSIT